MKTIILAGGWGTRLGRRTELIPKPMVKIGNRPILSLEVVSLACVLNAGKARGK